MQKNRTYFLSVFCLGLSAISLSCGLNDLTGNGNQKLPNKPIIQPIMGEPQRLSFTEDESNTLATFTPVYKDVENGSEKRATVVFRVKASETDIWSVIRDFTHYPNWIPDIKEAEIYNTVHEGDRDYTYVKFRLEKNFVVTDLNVTYYIKHNYPSNLKGWGSWTLDYDKHSAIGDSVGYWRVDPVAGKANECDVTYSAKIAVDLWDWIVEKMEQTGLEEATSWVRAQSEALANSKK